MSTNRNTTNRRIAAALIAVVGVIHLVLSPEYLDEQTYIGALFIAGGIGALAVAVRLWMTDDARAWGLGALITGGMFVGFILSRTTGLPGFHEEEWEASGIVSLILEAGFLSLFAASLRRPVERVAARPRRSSPARASARTSLG